MQITCPACDAIYEVPDERLRPGLFLRCHRCQHEWPAIPPPRPAEAAPEPAPPEPATPDQPPPAHAAPETARAPSVLYAERPPAPAARRGIGVGLALAWLLSFAVLAGAGWAAGTWHTQITAAWPPAQRLFSMLGVVKR